MLSTTLSFISILILCLTLPGTVESSYTSSSHSSVSNLPPEDNRGVVLSLDTDGSPQLPDPNEADTLSTQDGYLFSIAHFLPNWYSPPLIITIPYRPSDTIQPTLAGNTFNTALSLDEPENEEKEISAFIEQQSTVIDEEKTDDSPVDLTEDDYLKEATPTAEIVDEETDEIEPDAEQSETTGSLSINVTEPSSTREVQDFNFQIKSIDDPLCQSILENQERSPDSESLIPEPPTTIADIPTYTNKRIEAFIHLYAVKKRDMFSLAIQRSATYMPMIQRIFQEYELPPNLAYLAVVESNFNPNARSRANATGLWQFMGYTGKHYGLNRSWWHDERYDPEKSTIAAAQYLKHLHKRFNGEWELALAAYNSGGGTVRKAVRKAKAAGKSPVFWNLRLPRETRGYVPAFYAVATIFSDLEKYGFPPAPTWEPEILKQELDIARGVSLKQVATILDLDPELLVQLNPSLRFQGLTPPTYSSFKIAVPSPLEISATQQQSLEELEENRHQSWKLHSVEQGETLWSISRKYRVPISEIIANNRLRRKNLLRIGQKIMLPIPKDWTPPKSPSSTELAKRDLEKLPGKTHIHVVEKGDSLWTISIKYNVPIKSIRSWNYRVLKQRYLKIGTELVIKLPLEYAFNQPESP